MIIVGYPGIGKTSVCGHNNIIDLESYIFHNSANSINGNRYWEEKYCDVAMDLSNQGFTVCVSCHDEVRSYLENHQDKCIDPIVIVAPDSSLKEEWIHRLERRYFESRHDDPTPHWIINKNYAAYQHVKECFDLDMLSIQWSSLYKYTITQLPYDLNEVIERCKKAWFDHEEGVISNETGKADQDIGDGSGEQSSDR